MPDDSASGGEIIFEFYTPVDLQELAILDIDDGEPPVVRVTDTDDRVTLRSIPAVGNNGVYPLTVGISNVVKVSVTFPSSGAVAHLDYYTCPEGTSRSASSSSVTSELSCSETVVEDYELPGQALSWTDGTSSSNPGFTSFLGRLGAENDKVSKTWLVPDTASSVELKFDFYDIGGSGDAQLFLILQGSKINLKPFDDSGSTKLHKDHGVTGSNGNADGIYYGFVKSGGTVSYTLDIPWKWFDEDYNYLLPITFEVGTTLSILDDSYGIDNLSWMTNCGRRRELMDVVADGDLLEKFPAVEPSVDGDDKSPYCLAEDFHCKGEGMVYICHYNSRLGYETFCIPETDSEVLRFYRRDYCGPCVGGFGGANVV